MFLEQEISEGSCDTVFFSIRSLDGVFRFLAQLGILKLINQLALPNVDVFPLRNEHCFYVLIDTLKLL